MSAQRAPTRMNHSGVMLPDPDCGWLSDADLDTELARLTALRSRQELDSDPSTPRNTTPRTLLSLFRHA